MILDRAQIATLIPHAGAMCLLDGVLRWDAVSIRCVSARHRAPDNPLRHADGITAVCGIEFAAQAMAVHGRLAGRAAGKPQAGYLASVRDLACREDRLDLLAEELIIDAERLIGDEQRVVYQFAVRSAGRDVLTGRAAVVLVAAVQ